MTVTVKNDYARMFIEENWTDDDALEAATEEGLVLTKDHFDVIHSLQEYYSRHEIKHINLRELHDALDEKFHYKGGMKYLYDLFPGGPVAQGCRMAGLHAPAGAEDKGFGSAV